MATTRNPSAPDAEAPVAPASTDAPAAGTDVPSVPATDATDAPTVDYRALVAQASELMVLKLTDPDAYAATLAAERQVHEDYLAAAPGTPVYDVLVTLGIESARGGSTAATSTDSSGNGRGKMDADHAAEWLGAQKEAGKKGNKWPLIQAYRAAGNSANDADFFALVKEIWA